MENAVEALKMAGAVLLFVIALSVAILSFTTARESMDRMVKYADRESLTIENDSRFYYIANDNDVEDISKREDRTKRYVGLETIIPTIYRSVTENFKIIFDFGDSSTYCLYTNTNSGNKVYKFDGEMDELAFANEKDHIRFLSGIIYGVPNPQETNLSKYKSDFNLELPAPYLYEYISKWLSDEHKILESLGTYYMEDVSEDGTPSDKPESNKTEKRVITYTFM